ncbi:MAG: N-acetylmuramoyl-L-alanine amidase [candidate division FCPU426 bacterium]
MVIVIDPGHGGRDSGIESQPADPWSEKVLMMELARTLENRLEKKGFQVFLTRTGDESCSLLERMSLANRKNATVFISLHVGDRLGNRNPPARFFIHRVPTYKEKSASLNKGRLVAWETAQQNLKLQSRKVAEALRAAWEGQTAEIIEIPMAVLVGVNHPAVLAELPPPGGGKQEKKPGPEVWRSEAERLASGIERYLSSRGNK